MASGQVSWLRASDPFTAIRLSARSASAFPALPVAYERASPITVAGPCGILTRFPFPPRSAGHPKDVAGNMTCPGARVNRNVGCA